MKHSATDCRSRKPTTALPTGNRGPRKCALARHRELLLALTSRPNVPPESNRYSDFGPVLCVSNFIVVGQASVKQADADTYQIVKCLREVQNRIDQQRRKSSPLIAVESQAT